MSLDSRDENLVCCKEPVISENVVNHLRRVYPDLKQDGILKSLSSAPTTTTLRVNTLLITQKEAAVKLKDHLDAQHSKCQYHVLPSTHLEDILFVPMSTSAEKQCFYEKEVIVDSTCGTAVLRGADLFAPGILAAHPGMQKGDHVSVYADLHRKCRRGLVKVFNEPKYFVGNGIALCNRQYIFENDIKSLSGVAVKMMSPLPSFAGINESLYFPQNLPSMIVAHVMDPKEHDLVLDMCAAPGGKTTHLAILMKNKGKVIAIDKTLNKVKKMRQTCEKQRIENVTCFCFDSTKLHNDNQSQEIPTEPPFGSCMFDKILLDPPCSGLGQRPQLRYVMSDKEMESYPKYQRKLFGQAFKLLKPGGTLVYSTCTLMPEENERQVAWALKTFPELRLVLQEPFIGNTGLTNFGIAEEDAKIVQRFDKFLRPSQTDRENGNKFFDDTIGFFIAKFVKSSTAFIEE